MKENPWGGGGGEGKGTINTHNFKPVLLDLVANYKTQNGLASDSFTIIYHSIAEILLNYSYNSRSADKRIRGF